MTKTEVYILSAVRTPIGNLEGTLSTCKAHELGSVAIKEAIKRANLDNNDINQVIMGQALSAGQGQNPARQAAVAAGIPHSVTAYGINMLCGSGLKAVAAAYQAISNDDYDVIVAGGQESMSQAPHLLSVRKGIRMGNRELIDSMVIDGLTDSFHNIHMGETAENIAKQYSITRQEQDEFALESQKKTNDAQKLNLFDKEIVPVTIKNRKEVLTINKDEFPRPSTTLDGLSRLSPVFLRDGGTVTPGNASGINDGAAAVVLVSDKVASKKNLKPLAKIVGVAEAGVDPKIMGIGPVPAINKLLDKINWKKEDVDLFELNEAFAVQSIAVIRDLGIDITKVNVNGGAISLGHPIGASGARILVTLLHALQQRNGRKGIAALCIGGGMGIAMAVEVCK